MKAYLNIFPFLACYDPVRLFFFFFLRWSSPVAELAGPELSLPLVGFYVSVNRGMEQLNPREFQAKFY